MSSQSHDRSSQTYDMQEQLSKGEAAELLLDNHFAARFLIQPATRAQQRQGIDRIFTLRTTQKSYPIEYKTDWTAGRTGNAFIETISVDTMNVLGWVYTSQAEWLLYYVPTKKIIYIIRFASMRDRLDAWIDRYGPEKAIPNDGYFTRGIVVPLMEFEHCASKVETCQVD